MDERELKFPQWQIPLREAAVEADVNKLPGKIQRAETLIFQRLFALQVSNDGAGERAAIHDAIDTMRSLKSQRLQISDQK